MQNETLTEPETRPVYVSITGLRLKRWWHFLSFLRLSISAARQARMAEGNLATQLTRKNGVYHTLSVWRSEADMRNFLYDGAHMRSIRAFPRIATGKTFGFETTDVPELDAVHDLWLRHGREYTANNGWQ
jgi:hypothetical protein